MRTGRPLRVGGSSHVLIACAAAILLGVSHATSALAQATQATGKCIANLVAIAPKNPLGYSARSTPARCEGIHQTQFAGRIYLSAVGAGVSRLQPEALLHRFEVLFE